MANSQPAQIYLPSPSQKGDVSLEETIAKRRSIRHFTSEAISQLQLSQILWAAQGITDTRLKYRTVPSAGATYPLEIFVVCGRNGIEDMADGIYHYHIDSHSLALRYSGDVRLELAKAALDQEYIYEAPVDIIICAVYSRTLVGYGDRGERYVHIEVGHAGQNIYLQATALGLVTVAIGAFDDERVGKVLGLDKEYKPLSIMEPLYIMPVGRQA
ncbi:MAG: SagB/ThcOx family dehydrogenase [Dehalococcoidales bacterium]|nr:SagB/ThcOx family dehydrogenase [Dehalococcoidales bacterium]